MGQNWQKIIKRVKVLWRGCVFHLLASSCEQNFCHIHHLFTSQDSPFCSLRSYSAHMISLSMCQNPADLREISVSYSDLYENPQRARQVQSSTSTGDFTSGSPEKLSLSTKSWEHCSGYTI